MQKTITLLPTKLLVAVAVFVRALLDSVQDSEGGREGRKGGSNNIGNLVRLHSVLLSNSAARTALITDSVGAVVGVVSRKLMVPIRFGEPQICVDAAAPPPLALAQSQSSPTFSEAVTQGSLARSLMEAAILAF